MFELSLAILAVPSGFVKGFAASGFSSDVHGSERSAFQ